MIDVVVDQRLLGGLNGLLNRVKLLDDVKAWPVVAQHGQNVVQVPIGPLEPIEYLRMSCVHLKPISYPWGEDTAFECLMNDARVWVGSLAREVRRQEVA